MTTVKQANEGLKFELYQARSQLQSLSEQDLASKTLSLKTENTVLREEVKCAY